MLAMIEPAGNGPFAIGRRLGVSERTVGRYMTQALQQCYLTGMQP